MKSQNETPQSHPSGGQGEMPMIINFFFFFFCLFSLFLCIFSFFSFFLFLLFFSFLSFYLFLFFFPWWLDVFGGIFVLKRLGGLLGSQNKRFEIRPQWFAGIRNHFTALFRWSGRGLGSVWVQRVFRFRSPAAAGFIWFKKHPPEDEATRIQRDMQPFSRLVAVVGVGVRVRLGSTCLP